MRILLAACATLFALLHQEPVQPPTADQGPPLRVLLQIDGREHEFLDGETRTVAVGGAEVRAKVAVHANRRLQAAGLQFEFPRTMAVEHTPGPYLSMWTLDGGDCMLHVHSFADEGDASALAAEVLGSMLQSLEPAAKAPVAHAVSLGGVVRDGWRGRASLAGTSLEVTAVGLSVGGVRVVLMLQDSLADDGKATAESRQILQLLDKTLVLGGK